MGRLDGTISVTGLPPHRGLILNLCFYPVRGPESPAPHGGDPPAEAAIDCHEVVKDVHPREESVQAAYDFPFGIDHPTGHYFVQVRAILFRDKSGSLFAQAEQFFFSRRPVEIMPGSGERVTFPVSWPDLPLDALHKYGTVHPKPARPWWRFW